jgi:lipopolysaccharide assembly protein A
MRVAYFLILMLMLGAVGLFALQNREIITLKYLNWSLSCPVSLLVVIAYLLGMASGWTVLGVVRLSLRRVAAHPAH